MAEVPSDSVPPGLSMRYAGNFESFKVEEHVALCGAAHITALVDFLEQALEALKLVVLVNVLTKLKLDVLVKTFAGFLAQEALESLENCLGRLLKSEPG